MSLSFPFPPEASESMPVCTVDTEQEKAIKNRKIKKISLLNKEGKGG